MSYFKGNLTDFRIAGKLVNKILFFDATTTMQMLKNHTFLITRPRHQSQRLCAQIEQSGGLCILLPAIAINPFSVVEVKGAIIQLPQPIDKIIFTSANAVYPVMPFWSKIKAASTFAIGSGTARALADFNISAIVPESDTFNSKGILALSAMQALKGQYIVIFTGADGRMELADELTKREATVKKIAVYERQMPALKRKFPLNEAICLIVTTSLESLTNLWHMAGPAERTWLTKQQWLVINEAMQKMAKKLGIKQKPLLAKNASDEAILSAINKHLQDTQ
jgi:uroporphyrinogen-III synthase